MAVRASPPGIQAGEDTTIDALITDENEGPTLGSPREVMVSSDAPAGLIRVEQTRLVAGDRVAIDAARRAAGLAPDAGVPVDIDLVFEIRGLAHRATKRVFVGTVAENPATPELRVDGRVVTSEPIELSTDVEHELSVIADATDSVAWLTSIGELADSDDTLGHLTISDAASGMIVVVRRSNSGVAWRTAAVTAEP